tara:strand:- start:10449 stop:11213 length:765 start_codon:yes stop_codon:yes gene_type:complete
MLDENFRLEDNRSSYKKSGYAIDKFKNTETFEKVFRILKSFHDSEDLPKGWFWESKYPNTLDLRPNVYDIDRSFLEILSENNVLEKLRYLTGISDLVLSHVQIRKSSKGPSYMDWHRDSYFVDGKQIGNNPPVHKLIFYPLVYGEENPRLQLLEGSNSCQLNFQESKMMISPGFSQFDAQLMNFLPVAKYKSSKDKFLLFDTAGIHGAIPDTDDRGSIRVIYSFVSKDQFFEKYASKELHTVPHNILNKMLEAK